MTYAATEISTSLAKQTFLFVFAGPLNTYRWTNQPLTLTATIDATDYDFKHPRGGISIGNDPVESPDAGRTGIEIVVSPLNPIIRAHRSFPPPGNIELTIYRQNELDGEAFQIWKGTVVETPIVHEVSEQGESLSYGIIRCQHIAELIAGSEGLTEKWAPTCPFMTYHFPCPAQLNNHTTAVAVSAIDTDNFTVTVTGITQIDGWFNAGVLQAPNGDMRFILEHVGGVLTLQQNFASTTLKVGDAAVLIDGDDHLYATCRDKFGTETGNGAAFGGNHLQANRNPHEIGRLQ